MRPRQMTAVLAAVMAATAGSGGHVRPALGGPMAPEDREKRNADRERMALTRKAKADAKRKRRAQIEQRRDALPTLFHKESL